jgi:hypothetical protein
MFSYKQGSFATDLHIRLTPRIGHRSRLSAEEKVAELGTNPDRNCSARVRTYNQ